MVRVRLLLLTAILVVMPTLAAAKPAPPHINVPDQPWYPPGYRDLRIAAGETVRTFPRDSISVLNNFGDRGDHSYKTYDVIDCMLGYDLPKTPDWQLYQREMLALDVARMRSEFAKLGYSPKVYDGALLEYERDALAHFPSVAAPWWFVHDAQALPEPMNDGVTDAAPIEHDNNSVDEPQTEAAAAGDTEAGVFEDDTSGFWRKDELAAKMEAIRARLQPNKPRIMSEGGCGGGESEFTVELSPPDGRLWLINAFAFKVCERRLPDPWNHIACSWNEYTTGEKTAASGRYIYEARWPDGTVRRGAKLLEETEDGGAIVIRRN